MIEVSVTPDQILGLMRTEMRYDEVDWTDGPPPRKTSREGAELNLSAAMVLLKLVPGKWIRIGPVSVGSYQERARKRGLEVAQRREGETTYIYLRYPEGAS